MFFTSLKSAEEKTTSDLLLVLFVRFESRQLVQSPPILQQQALMSQWNAPTRMTLATRLKYLCNKEKNGPISDSFSEVPPPVRDASCPASWWSQYQSLRKGAFQRRY